MFILPLPATIIEEIQIESEIQQMEISLEISEQFEELALYERNLLTA